MKQDVKGIKLDAIAIPEKRMRAHRPEQVDAIAQSMNESGLLQPIVVRPLAARKFMLIAGRHRLEAARQLGWTTIDCRVLKGIDLLHAQLAEIDENLIRDDLSMAERAMHRAKRKEIYENLNPQAKRGAAGGAATKAKHEGRAKYQNDTQPSPRSYIDDDAKKTGQSRITVSRDAKRGAAIDGDVLVMIAGTSLDSGEELDALAKMTIQGQRALAERAARGEPVSAKSQMKRARRAQREAELGAKQAAMPKKKYGVIYADPPWKFETWSDDGAQRRIITRRSASSN
jgi:hypothetical protein